LALRKGIFASAIMIAIFSFFLVKYVLGPGHMGIYWSIITGLGAGILMGLSTEYFTSATYKPTQFIAGTA
jgi:K(+)-stimulated pyrophosphate-energized sodium pump